MLKDGFIKLYVIPCKLTDSERRNNCKHLKNPSIMLLKEKCAVVPFKKIAEGLITIKQDAVGVFLE